MITLPRGVEVDAFALPEDFDEIVLRCFAEYTEGTSKDYRDVDRLGFIDVFVKHLHKESDYDEIVDDYVKEYVIQQWDEEGALPDEDDIYCKEFMYECCRRGQQSREMAAHYGDDNHIYDEIHKILARVMKIVSNATEEQLEEVLKHANN